MSTPFSCHRLLTSTSLLIVSLLIFGCLGASKLPLALRAPNNTVVEKKELDFSFVRAGTTRREDVMVNLGAIDSGYADSRLFWGRWASSSWGYIVRLDAGRIWRVHNLLITFDANGVVLEQQFIDNNRTLWRTLRDYVSKTSALDLSQPTQLAITGTYGRHKLSDVTALTLSKDALEFSWANNKRSARISPMMVSRFFHLGEIVDAEYLNSTCHILRFKKKTPLGKMISFCAEPSDMMKLMAYLQQTGPPDMAWE